MSSNRGIVEVVAANYLELLGAFVAGGDAAPDSTHAFLRDCCLGGWRGGAGDGDRDSDWLRP